jgi:hypothetical protein
MAADREVIQEFLVSLGFKIDEPGMKKFGNVLGGTAKSFMGVAGAVVGAAAAVDAFVDHFASGIEKLYFQSTRAGTTATNLLSFGQAAAQVGLDADSMKQSVVSMVAAVDASGGALREVQKGLGVSDEVVDNTERYLQMQKKLVEGYKEGGVARANAISLAGMFGESQEQLALIATSNNLQTIIDKYHELQKVNNDLSPEVQRAAHDEQNAWRDFTNALSSVGRQTSEALLPFETGLARIGTSLLNLVSSGKAWHNLWTQGFQSGGFTTLMESIFDAQDKTAKVAAEHKREDEAAATHGLSAGLEVNPTGVAGRNKNPGNLKYAGQPGAIGQDEKGFAVFDTVEHGIAAQQNQLRLYGSRGNDTLSGMIAQYAPKSDNNDTGEYIKHVSALTGFDPNQHLNLNDADVNKRVSEAMMLHEGGLIGAPIGGRSGTGGGAGDVTVTNNFQPNIQVTGAGNPHDTAAAVSTAVEGSYSTMQRNQKSAFNNVQPQGLTGTP